MKNIRIIFLISILITVISLGVAVYFTLSESGVRLGEVSLSELIKNEDTQFIAFLPLVLLIVAASFIPFYRIFFPMKIKNGIKTTARVLEVNDTGVTVNDNPQVGLKLEFRTQEGAIKVSMAKTIVSRLTVAHVLPGATANIIYDPLKPDRVQVESFEIGEQPVADRDSADERPPSTTERLLELNDLRARGLVTDQEYQAKRAEILEDV